MEFKGRRNDVSQVFDRQWQVSHNYQGRKQFLDARKDHFNKLHNVVDKDAQKKEILEANSVSGRVSRLQKNMDAMKGNELLRNQNKFR